MPPRITVSLGYLIYSVSYTFILIVIIQRSWKLVREELYPPERKNHFGIQGNWNLIHEELYSLGRKAISEFRGIGI